MKIYSQYIPPTGAPLLASGSLLTVPIHRISDNQWRLTDIAYSDWVSPVSVWSTLRTPNERFNYFFFSLARTVQHDPLLEPTCNRIWQSACSALSVANCQLVSEDGSIVPRVLGAIVGETKAYPMEFMMDFWGLFTQKQLVQWVLNAGQVANCVKRKHPLLHHKLYSFWSENWPGVDHPVEVAYVVTERYAMSRAVASYFFVHNLYFSEQPSGIYLNHMRCSLPRDFMHRTVQSLSGQLWLAIVNEGQDDLNAEIDKHFPLELTNFYEQNYASL